MVDRTFSNTDAAICGGVAVAELIFCIVYISVTSVRLRKKVISMGRLIPATPVIIVGGNIPTYPVQTYPPQSQNMVQNPYGQAPPNPYGQAPPNPYANMDQTVYPGASSAPPPGFQQVQDLPPPYATVETKP